MKKKKLFLIAQSVLCVALTAMLAAAALGLYREGLALKAADPLSWIYTREKVIAAMTPMLPLLMLSLAVTLVGLFLGLRDGNADKSAGVRAEAGRGEEQTRGSLKALRTALLILALALIAAGIFNGSARDVFGKAVKICTECVGLG